VNVDQKAQPQSAVSIADKVAALSQGWIYGLGAGAVPRTETHMSWVFFADDHVYKLKKPVRFPYLDFSTLARREAACRAEVALNQVLAPGVYLGLVPLRMGDHGLQLGGEGEIVDWLVLMRRLGLERTLDRRLAAARPSHAELERLAQVLTRFYRHARPLRIGAPRHLMDWRRALAQNRAVLLNPALGMSPGQIRWIFAVLRRTLLRCRLGFAERLRHGRVVDGHGDLRPEHIFLGVAGVMVIDRLEFNAALRIIDVVDELAFLELECERLGAPAMGLRLRRRVQHGLGDRPPEALVLFYRCHRALLRARLSIAHLLEPDGRTPEKWPRQARAYLAIAARDAQRLERRLNRPGGR
jgi:uncharacterized protein